MKGSYPTSDKSNIATSPPRTGATAATTGSSPLEPGTTSSGKRPFWAFTDSTHINEISKNIDFSHSRNTYNFVIDNAKLRNYNTTDMAKLQKIVPKLQNYTPRNAKNKKKTWRLTAYYVSLQVI